MSRFASWWSTTTRCSAAGCAPSSRPPAIGEVEVLAEAADVDEAVRAVADHSPDVVLLDVHLPGGGGVEVMRRSGGDHDPLPRAVGL